MLCKEVSCRGVLASHLVFLVIAISCANADSIVPASRPDDLPAIRYVAWQNPFGRTRPGTYWHPDGSAANGGLEWYWFDDLPPGPVLLADANNHRVLQLWFSHPNFDSRSLAQVDVLDGKGDSLSDWAGYSSNSFEREDFLDHNGWLAIATSLRAETDLTTATVVLSYTVGDWTLGKQIPAGATTPVEFSDGVPLTLIGQNDSGHAFITIQRDRTKTGGEQFDVIGITQQGDQLPAQIQNISGPENALVERFEFSAALAGFQSFQLRTRALKTVVYRSVSLQAGLMTKPAEDAGFKVAAAAPASSIIPSAADAAKAAGQHFQSLNLSFEDQATGKPIPDMDVYMRDSHGVRTRMGSSGPDGRVLISFPMGWSWLEIYNDKYVGIIIRTLPRGGQTWAQMIGNDGTIKMEPGTKISGKVVDGSGSPIAGAMVELSANNGDPQLNFGGELVQADENGVWEFTRAPANLGAVTASAWDPAGGNRSGGAISSVDPAKLRDGSATFVAARVQTAGK